MSDGLIVAFIYGSGILGASFAAWNASNTKQARIDGTHYSANDVTANVDVRNSLNREGQHKAAETQLLESSSTCDEQAFRISGIIQKGARDRKSTV